MPNDILSLYNVLVLVAAVGWKVGVGRVPAEDSEARGNGN